MLGQNLTFIFDLICPRQRTDNENSKRTIFVLIHYLYVEFRTAGDMQGDGDRLRQNTDGWFWGLIMGKGDGDPVLELRGVRDISELSKNELELD